MLSSLLVCFGQNSSQIKRADKGDAKYGQERVEVLRASLLSRLDDAVRLMDEPAMRVLIRLRIATYLWSKKAQSERFQGIAEREVEDALSDIAEHRGEISDGTESRLRNDLFAQIQLNSPALAAKLKKKYAFAEKVNSSDELLRAYSLLNSPNGSTAAVASLKRLISNGQDLGMDLGFFLDRLEREDSSELLPLLSYILAAEQSRPGAVSLTTLEYISRFYLRDDRPHSLKLNFLTAVVNATRDPSAFSDVPRLRQARNFLNNLVPLLGRLSPVLYEQAMVQLSVISSRLPPENVSMQSIAERVKRSQDPLEAWIEEADSPENKVFRNDILTEAAQLALEKKKLELAIDIVSKIEIKDEDKNTPLWRAQFLEDVSDSALKVGKPDIARRAEERIEDVLTRTQALRKIVIYYLQTGDAASAEEFLGTALKLAASIVKASDRAAAYLDLTEACQRLDEGKLYDVISLAVKAINGMDAPDTQDKPGSPKRDGYARELSALSWRLTPAFQSLVSRNEDDAFYFAEAIQRREMRAAALLGIYMGLPDVPNGQSHKVTE
jgi:hypothetical protein